MLIQKRVRVRPVFKRSDETIIEGWGIGHGHLGDDTNVIETWPGNIDGGTVFIGH